MVSYRAVKLRVDARARTHTQTDAGNDNTRWPKLASGKNLTWDPLGCMTHTPSCGFWRRSHIGTSRSEYRFRYQDITQTVQIGSSISEPVTLKYGVPQGSVLGPILFTMYTTRLGNIIRNHSLDFHLYADETQLYISFKPCDSISRQTAIPQVEACIKDIKTWVTTNLVKLNYYHQRNYQPPGRHCDSPFAPSMEPHRNIGVLFDSTYCLNDHVNQICRNINYQLYSIGKIRKYLSKPTTECR